jgi:hypothetical protein
MTSVQCDLAVWNEVAIAVGLELLPVGTHLDAVKLCPNNCERILTGRCLCKKLRPLWQFVTNL